MYSILFKLAKYVATVSLLYQHNNESNKFLFILQPVNNATRPVALTIVYMHEILLWRFVWYVHALNQVLSHSAILSIHICYFRVITQASVCNIFVITAVQGEAKDECQ